MSHYEERLERDLNRIRASMSELARDVQNSVAAASRVFLTGDRELANATILRDQLINRSAEAVDRRCQAFVARHLPSAGHLRFISSCLRLTIALERVGDYAVTICREFKNSKQEPPEIVKREFSMFYDEAKLALEQALKSFEEMNPELARGTREMASHVASTYDMVFAELISLAERKERSVGELFGFLVIFNRLSRICDQAKNICEEAIFAATGETKPPKTFKVLFLDEKGECLSPMAWAVAKHLLPEGAEFAYAGFRAAESFNSSFCSVMNRKGHDLSMEGPRQFDSTVEGLARFHLIILLQGDVSQGVAEIPYRTVILNWNLIYDSEALESEEEIEKKYQEISRRMSQLFEILRGKDFTQ